MKKIITFYYILSKLQRKLYFKSFECYNYFEIIDIYINTRLIRLLPSNNPDSTSVRESSLHKKHVHLPIPRYTLSLFLSLAQLPWMWHHVERINVFSGRFVYLPSCPLSSSHSRSAFSLKTMWGCGGFVFDPDKLLNTHFMHVSVCDSEREQDCAPVYKIPLGSVILNMLLRPYIWISIQCNIQLIVAKKQKKNAFTSLPLL